MDFAVTLPSNDKISNVLVAFKMFVEVVKESLGEAAAEEAGPMLSAGIGAAIVASMKVEAS